MNLKSLTDKQKIIALIIVLILCFTGIIGIIYEHTFKYLYIITSKDYLDSSINKSTNIFLSISTIKAFIAIIEGSEMGISAIGQFSLQVGDIVQSLYDTIDIMWKVSFLGVVSLSIQKIFLEYFPNILLSYMVGISVLLYIPSIFFENFMTSFTKKTSKFVTIIYVSVYFLIPFNIYMASKTSEYLDTKYKEPAIIMLKNETDKLSEISIKLSQLRIDEEADIKQEEIKWYDVKTQISKGINYYNNEISTMFKNLKKMQSDLEKITSKILKISITIITIYITNAILIPFVFLGLTYLFIQIVFLGQTVPTRGKKNNKV